MAGLSSQLRRFASDERGIFGVIFAILAVVLVAMSGAVVDFVSVEQARTRSQVALDAAALALQRQLYTTPRPSSSSLQEQAQKLLVQQVNDSTITATVTDVTPNFDTSTIDISATIDVPTNFVRLVGVSHLQANLLSEVTRGSVNLEVGLALDVTGSMNDTTKTSNGKKSTKIADLRAATSELIDLVVQDEQEPSYTRMAMAPYSTAVNVGDYADKVRGTIKAGEKITGATWAGTSKSMSGATQERPVKITTSSSLGVSNGDWVTISGLSGNWRNPNMTELNDEIFKVTSVSGKTFKLLDENGNNVDGRYYNAYTSGGTVTKCQFAKCEVQVTVKNNTVANGDRVYITGVGGLSNINDDTFIVGSRTSSTYLLGGSLGSGSYTSGGTSYCTVPGCEYYYFQQVSGNHTTYQITDCASERTTNPFNDTAPNVTPLGRVYAGGSDCSMPEILPLTSNKDDLHDLADDLVANGSTAGHLGLAWAWYLVSPEFAYLFSGEGQAAAYDAPNTQKVVILMTDGAFNTVYCNGVVGSNSVSGSGDLNAHINCPSPNGDIFTQANAICDAIKAPHGDAPPVIVYTVGFDIADDENAKDLMANCATDSDHTFLANNGDDLKQVFRAIGQNITSLRVSR